MPEVWDAKKDDTTYSAESLESEGFIHCSFAGQLAGVFARYYAGAEKVVLLEIDPEKLLPELRIEPSTNNENYPHIYGAINLDSVVGVTEKILKN